MAHLEDYFLNRVRGWRMAAFLVAPVAWFQIVLLFSGLYQTYTLAQSGPPLEETPFFSAGIAVERLGAIADAGRTDTAYLFYVADFVSAILLAAALAALIAFGLRAAHAAGGKLRHVVLLPLGVIVAELAENALLAVALATYPDFPPLLGTAAGIATGLKFVLIVPSALLALGGLVVGGLLSAKRVLAIGQRDE
ncbi:hypothetical protein [Pelagibacterium halotolerans]|uniref:hypothetical protein n=1 Tax=Pelagibacterium halotolerans TaxID=531813 RepID=UPI00384F5C05